MEPEYIEYYSLLNRRWGWNIEFQVAGHGVSGEAATLEEAETAVRKAIEEKK